MGIKTFGLQTVDWEERVNYERLRTERLARVTRMLAASELGALLCFDMNNIRYITATHIGTWAMDKLVRFALLPRGDEPILWDFGSAARHHQLYCPWLGDRSRAGISTLRGAYPESAHDVARKIKTELAARGLDNAPVGVDLVEPQVLFALQQAGVRVVDGQSLMQEVRKIKTQDEITLITTAVMMVDAAYDALYQALRPGMRENECVGLVAKVLYDLGSEHVEGVNAISGERCSPHPHVYTDRVLRPGDPAYFDILHAYNGYRTCYYRTFSIGSASPAMVDAYRRCRDYLDAALSLIRPGVTTAASGVGVAEGRGVRVRGRRGGVRAAVRPRGGAVNLGEADFQPAGLVRSSRGDRGRDGVRPRDLLAGIGRLVGRPHRGAARRNEGRVRGDHTVPGGKPARGRDALLDGRRTARDDPGSAVESQPQCRAGARGPGHRERAH